MWFPSVHRQTHIWRFQEKQNGAALSSTLAVQRANAGGKSQTPIIVPPTRSNRTERRVIHLYCIIQMLGSHWETRLCSLSITFIGKAQNRGEAGSCHGPHKSCEGHGVGDLTAFLRFTRVSRTNALHLVCRELEGEEIVSVIKARSALPEIPAFCRDLSKHGG